MANWRPDGYGSYVDLADGKLTGKGQKAKPRSTLAHPGRAGNHGLPIQDVDCAVALNTGIPEKIWRPHPARPKPKRLLAASA